MKNIKCIEVTKINNPQVLANVIYNNFSYLKDFPELGHTPGEITKSLQSEDNLCYLVYDKNKLIGYLVGEYKLLNDKRYIYYISYLYVSEEYRGKQIGSKLMDIIINKCQNDGIEYIILTCDTWDEKIVNFYKKYGFVLDPVLGGEKRHNVYCLFLK